MKKRISIDIFGMYNFYISSWFSYFNGLEEEDIYIFHISI